MLDLDVIRLQNGEYLLLSVPFILLIGTELRRHFLVLQRSAHRISASKCLVSLQILPFYNVVDS